MMQTAPAGTAGTFAQRSEHKYWLPRADLGAIIDALHTYVPTFSYTPTGWTSVRSLYLDTQDLQFYRDYVVGLTVRWKIRIREYGHQGQFGENCWVEAKMKNRGISSKRRFACQVSDVARMVDEGADISSIVKGNGDPKTLDTYCRIASLIKERSLRPVVCIQYERMAFQRTATDEVRITLDRDVRARGATGRPEGQFTGLVLEIKSVGERPEWFYEVRDKVMIHRAHRMSKYAWAIGRVMGIRNVGAQEWA
jgi:SPX domain protein involved in polyphosphate accumulation